MAELFIDFVFVVEEIIKSSDDLEINIESAHQETFQSDANHHIFGVCEYLCYD